MSDFLEFVLANGPEGRVTHGDVVRWAGALDNWEFYNAAAAEIAGKYHHGVLTYVFCDGVMNDLWSAVQEGFGSGHNAPPQPFYDVYEAFDAGEYHRQEDGSDDPVADFTDPLIAELAARLAHRL
ncbi:hypothetical protein [Ensifer sp.]|jgi:hypothetical protein|uniref:hypothetical protein n=1 Tax=Ensifer sp. TaxID=1872086 RepID=UPI002E0D92A5|nr:hypothetical protein [Ensifer sp.]